MERILILLIVSTLTGMIIGLKYSVYVVGIAALVIAAVVAIALRDLGFDAAAMATFACLIVNQIGYLAGAWLRFRRATPSDPSSEEQSDDQSSDDR